MSDFHWAKGFEVADEGNLLWFPLVNVAMILWIDRVDVLISGDFACHSRCLQEQIKDAC